jgi:hypothetical protein
MMIYPPSFATVEYEKVELGATKLIQYIFIPVAIVLPESRLGATL